MRDGDVLTRTHCLQSFRKIRNLVLRTQPPFVDRRIWPIWDMSLDKELECFADVL